MNQQYEQEVTLTAEELTKDVSFDLAEQPAEGTKTVLKAAVLDRVVVLDAQ